MQTKYDARTYDIGRRLQSKAFDERVALRDSLDPHFTKLWLDYAIDGFGNAEGARRAHALPGDGRAIHYGARRRIRSPRRSALR